MSLPRRGQGSVALREGRFLSCTLRPADGEDSTISSLHTPNLASSGLHASVRAAAKKIQEKRENACPPTSRAHAANARLINSVSAFRLQDAASGERPGSGGVCSAAPAYTHREAQQVRETRPFHPRQMHNHSKTQTAQNLVSGGARERAESAAVPAPGRSQGLHPTVSPGRGQRRPRG